MNFDQVFTQKRFADELSSRLQLFVKRSDSPYLANFRCDICGDSKKNKYKKRGYLLSRNGGPIMYCCQNCNQNIPLGRYIKQYHNDLYGRYTLEMMSSRDVVESPKPQTQPILKPYVHTKNVTKGLIAIPDLPRDHYCIQYLRSRKLPAERCKDLFYAPKFYQYVNSVLPGKFKKDIVERLEHSRLVMPLRTTEGVIFGVNARAFDDNGVRYLTLKFDESQQKIFGLEQINFDKDVKVLEGPLDSLFVENSCAICGTDADISLIFKDKKKYTYVLDNQPRNKEVVAKYSKYIATDHKIVIWPEDISQKDINDMILYGNMSVSDINTIIEQRTFSGPVATIHFNKWRKILD